MVDGFVFQAMQTLVNTDPIDVVKVTRQQTLIKEVPRILAAIREEAEAAASNLHS